MLGRGTTVYTSWETMLAAHLAEIDVVCIPTPVPDHAPMHRRCVELGLPAFLEKPPSLDYAEYCEMVATEAARRDGVAETFVGACTGTMQSHSKLTYTPSTLEGTG